MKITVGIDVGNYDTKTQHTAVPSSYQVSDQENKLAEENLFYEGKFYTLTRQRNNQMLDKTENKYCIIMSLFGIAKEIIWQINERNKGNQQSPDQPQNEVNKFLTPEQLQNEINKYDEVVIGAGLPVGYFSSLAKKTITCYMENMGNGVDFIFNGYEFHLKLTQCRMFPQDFTAVVYNRDITTPKTYSEYYIIGIGGGTVDIIPVVSNEPQVANCKSIEKGTTFMFEYISRSIQHETGRTLDYNAIETILKGGKSIIDEKRKNRIHELASEFITKLVDDMIHSGLRLSDYPCVMVGGGAQLMKKTLESNSQFAALEFIDDVNVNAKYFAAFAQEG